MRVLWFTNTASLYDKGTHNYHGGGWIESLEKLFQKENHVDLGVSFFHEEDDLKKHKNNTTYYPLLKKRSRKKPFRILLNNWKGNIEDANITSRLLEVIEDFCPDLIQIFGTERVFGRILAHIDIPVVIHLQGLINPCLNAYFPPGTSELEFITDKNYFQNNLAANSPYFSKQKFAKQADREVEYLQNVNHVMGRTGWDNMVAKFYSPEINYFHVDEVLRPHFYSAETVRNSSNKEFISIVTTISSTIYKGIDVILKTAKLLKDSPKNINFRWKLIGLEKRNALLKHFEQKINVHHEELGIQCMGRKSPQELITTLQGSDIYVHPSYIDNSPNSVYEAQMLGLPVIACDVGGLSSIIEHEKSGILVPSNGIFEIAHHITKFSDNKDTYIDIGDNARNLALKRHDRKKIVDTIMNVYHCISSC